MRFSRLIFVCLLMLFQATLWGKHLVGGTLYYELVSKNGASNTYRVTIELYRDCTPGNTQFDEPDRMYIGVFRGDNKMYVKSVENVMRTYLAQVNPILDPCVKTPTNLCYEKAVYVGTVSLPVIQAGYYLTWGRCCRNATIANIVNPENTGMSLEAYIPDMSKDNNAPVFAKDPPTFVCANRAFSSDMSATDKDGDSLVYALSIPLTDGTPDQPLPYPTPPPHDPIFWQQPYNINNILGGNPPMQINPQTGVISAVPPNIGQFVYCVTVTEYRNGVKLSEVRRDIQINVVPCEANNPPITVVKPSEQVNQDTLFFYAGEDMCFDFDITDTNGSGYKPDTLKIEAFGDLLAPGGNSIIPPYATFSAPAKALSPAKASLCWATECNQVGEGKFTIRVTDQNDCPGPNVVNKTYHFVLLPGRATPPDIRCVSVTGPDQITLTWKVPPQNKLRGFQGYVLQRYTGTSWQAIDTIMDVLQSTYVDNNALNAYSQQYCYRLATAKVCPNPFVGQAGQEGCSILVGATPISSVEAEANWNGYNIWTPPNYQLWANPVGQPATFVSTIPSDTFASYLGCTFEGYLTIQLKDPLTGCTVQSAPSNTLTLTDLVAPDIDLCVASVEEDDSGVRLNWGKFEGDDFRYYRVYRANRGANNFSLIAELKDINDTTYSDKTALVDELAYCYYVEKSDLCGNVQKTGKDCTILLKGRGEDYQVFLNWQNYTGWEPGANNVELWKTDPNGVMQNLYQNLGFGETSYRDLEVVNEVAEYCYRVKNTRSDTPKCTEAWSNAVCITFSPTLFFPNAFTPNGDGRNDFFVCSGVYAQQFEMTIYNRWGTLVFYTTAQSEGWDGYIEGVPAPEGVYVFRSKAVGYKGEVIEKTGTVMLMR